MEVGDLKDRITLEQLTTSVNGRTGELQESWATYASVWTKKEAFSGSEGEKKNIVQQQQKIDFIIRYNATIDLNASNFRVVYNSNTLDLESAEEMTTESVRMWMRLRCVFRSNA